jgi:hypothetical protein
MFPKTKYWRASAASQDIVFAAYFEAKIMYSAAPTPTN